MLCDEDEDGVVSLQELSTLLKALGQRPSGNQSCTHVNLRLVVKFS